VILASSLDWRGSLLVMLLEAERARGVVRGRAPLFKEAIGRATSALKSPHVRPQWQQVETGCRGCLVPLSFPRKKSFVFLMDRK